MAVPIVLSPDTAYATKDNILRPGSQAQATAAEGRAEDRADDAYPDGVTLTVAAGAIEVES
jgi:hypothetical protein